jgi:diguanylate cyclase (GGDEF)-like protein
VPQDHFSTSNSLSRRLPMFNRAQENSQAGNLFVNSTNAEELRAQRVWRFIIVLWLTWIFNAFFLWYRGYEAATIVCFADSVIHLIILVTCRKQKNYAVIMNLNLMASAVGLFFVSVSDPALSGTMLFYPVAILVASQLLGVRSAFVWLVINFVAFVLFFVTVYGVHQSFSTWRFDEFMLILGVASCIFFCCQQGESYYQERTKDLIKLSQKLQKKSEKLHVLATTDALTGLINRFQFQNKLKDAVLKTSGDTKTALFLVDMDGFKEINDTLGHLMGDKALVEIAERLNQEFGDCSEVARLGGDEFCIIQSDIQNRDQASEIALKIGNLLNRRYVLEEANFQLGASVGVALCPDDTQSDQELLSFADTAMYFAKENKMIHACYEPGMTDRLVEYRMLQEKLSVALENEEFFLVYQPQVNLQTGEVIGVEALLRWQQDGETIPPYRFIPLLEQSREIIPVSRWIVHECCRQQAEWTRDGHDIEVSLNISAVQFKDEEFCESVAASIREFSIDPHKLDFEITEGLLIDDVAEAVEILNQIKEMGISISIDDFGTGYSSLAYLRQFPLDRLKIDLAFIKNIPEKDDGLIAASIIVLAKALDLKVLAEGVETEAHLKFLREHDCDEYQGYYLSPPVPPEEVVAFFNRKQATANLR